MYLKVAMELTHPRFTTLELWSLLAPSSYQPLFGIITTQLRVLYLEVYTYRSGGFPTLLGVF